MAILNIDGVDLPAPSSMKIPQSDLDSSDTNRNELGFLQRDRIRQGIYKIELEWKAITDTKLNTILDAVEPASIQVTFPFSKGFLTKTMYAGDRNIEIALYRENDIRWNISFSLTEY
ncbi:DUF6711 family protein [Brassicibacter mesophilus]|uniref:DUF6711 family protein n=1 Tax=Brassicibacter mesophilus TaxID=745119 RepID=UPI003D224F9B